jgi:hypothetical protein
VEAVRQRWPCDCAGDFYAHLSRRSAQPPDPSHRLWPPDGYH